MFFQTVNTWCYKIVHGCWWECKLVQPLWRTVWKFLQKLEIEVPYDWAIPLLGIHTAAAAAKLLQSCPTLCDPIDGSPLCSSVPGILQARTLEWVAISFSNAWKWKVKVKLLSHAQLLATPWTAAYQALPSMGFSRQKYWSGVPLPSLFIYIMRNAGLEETQSGIKIVGRNINNLRYADDTTLMAESEENSKASWWKWKWRVKKLA